MRVIVCLVLTAIAALAFAHAVVYGAQLPEPNYIDLRVLATYSVVLPDGTRMTIDSVSLARAIVSEARAQQARENPPKEAE